MRKLNGLIDSSKIQILIDWYHNNCWMLHLPFLIYFTFSLTNIGMMKMEISGIENVIENLAHESKITLQDQYEEWSFFVGKIPEFERFYIDIKKPLDFVQSTAFLNAEDMEGELEYLDDQLKEMLDMNNAVFKIDQNLIKLAKEYPTIKKYVSLQYATEMTYILFSRSGSFGCNFICRYFNPRVQQFGDKYFLYPNIIFVNEFSYSELTINGELVEDFKHKFQPKRKGMHILDIQFSYFYNMKKEVIKFRKGLMVK